MNVHYGFCAASILFALSAHLFAFQLVKQEAPYYRLFHPIALLIAGISGTFFYVLLQALQSFSYQSHLTYGLFAFALCVTAQTDAQTLLISRWASLFLVPVAWIGANLGFITITPLSSIFGALVGLLTLALTARLALRWTGQESIGQGDIDFLACIGAFLGPLGCWQSLLFGSVTGSLFGIVFLAIHGKQARKMKLPFGTFLAFGAMAQLLMQLKSQFFFSF